MSTELHAKLLIELVKLNKMVVRNQIQQADINKKIMTFTVDFLPNVIFDKYELLDPEDLDGPDDGGSE